MPSLRSFLPARSSLAVAFLLFSIPLLGQGSELFLVTDLNDRGVVAPHTLSDFFRAGDAAVFVQENPESPELWVTGGTAPGTRRLPVVCDPCSEVFLVVSDGARVFFFADGGLGVTDGTPAGTRTLLAPGTLERAFSATDDAFAPSLAGARVFFAASDEDAGLEPWVSDGTPEGTFRLLDAFPGPRDSRPRLGPVVRNRLLFVAEAGEDGDALWRTDGTPGGTALLMDLDLGIESGSFPAPILLGERAVFFAEDELGETMLWSTDGTAGGTRLVAPIDGMVSLGPPLRVSGLLFFPASLPDGDDELWRTDGTPEGTFPIARFGGLPTVDLLGGAGDVLVFDVRRALRRQGEAWRSDGTAEGTFPLDVRCEPRCDQPPRVLAELDDHLFFTFPVPDIGVEAWVTDGSLAGTHPVADLCLGPCSSDPARVARGSAAVYVTAGDPLQGRELFRLEPGQPPTRLTDFLPADPFVFLRPRSPLSGRLDPGLPTQTIRRGPFRTLVLSRGALFAASEPVEGFSLYLTNDVPESTRKLAELAPARNAGSFPDDLTGVGEELVFTATDGILPRRLWRTDGSAGGTAALDVLTQRPEDGGPFEPVSLARYEDGFVLWARGPDDRFDLWRVSPSGAVKLTQGLPGVPGLGPPSSPPALVVVGSQVFFATHEGLDGPPPSLWVSDGTPEGTGVVREFFEISPLRLVAFDGGAAFVASESFGQKAGIWTSDGTAAGTRLVFELPPPQVYENLVAAGDRLFFTVVASGPVRNRLFVLDGADGEARELKSDALVFDPFAAGSQLFFVASDLSRHALWVSDGTADGTRFLAELGILRPSAFFEAFSARLGDTVFILDGEPEPVGNRLMSRILATDGTPAGTRQTRLLPAGVRPTGVAAAGDLLVIESAEGEGSRLWVSRGGTSPARRLSPTFFDVGLSKLTVLGSLAFVPADDDSTGRELWALDLTTPPPAPCVPGPRTLCITEDRFRVEVDWHDPRSGSSGRGFVVPGTQLADSGFFWFFDPDNVELVVKVLDARPVNGHFWFFSGSLTDVERTITVTDTASGITKTYHREAGDPTGHVDVTAF